MTWPLPVGGALGALVLLLVVTGLALYVRRRRHVARDFGDPELLHRLTGLDLNRVPWWRALLVLCGAAALAIALMDPRWGEGEGSGRSSGGPVVLVIDVSSSMLVGDAAPSRLAWARAAATRLAEALGDSPIGIVVFAGRAYALTPPTRDPGAIDLYLEALDTRMVSQTGSALAAAIRQGVGLLLAGEGEGGALVVISDGNTMEEPGDLESAIELARRASVPVFTVGVGTTSGGPVPDLDPVTGERIGYLRWPNGETVESHLSEEILRAVARGTGASYLQANRASPERLAALVGSVAGAAEDDSFHGRRRFAWFAATALLLLVLESLIGRARAGRGSRLGLAGAALLLCGGCDSEADIAPDARTSADSIEMYREIAAARPGDPLPLYDLGTVLLQAQHFEDARPPLEVAARTTSPELRQRARYNLGNTRLEPFFAASTRAAPDEEDARVQVLREAVEDYRQALLLDSSDVDAKWNLELAHRLLREERTPPPQPPEPPEPEGAGAGGGGGGGGSGGGGSDSESANQNPAPQSGSGGAEQPQMSRAEAEALLDNARDRELGVQRETLAKPQSRGGVAH